MIAQQKLGEHVDNLQKGAWDILVDFLSYKIFENENGDHKIVLTVGVFLFFILVFVLTIYILKYIKKFVTRKLPETDKMKFDSIFSFAKYFLYAILALITLDNIGININAIFAASAALLVGVGLALQTLIQDILSGVFILMDQTVHVGDIIEIDNKVGRVEEIKLRTTRTVTIDNKVLIIPNHKYLSSSLYNWTQNGKVTRESVTVGVAYGSDLQKVKELLLLAASKNNHVLGHPAPLVLFTDFADSALSFKLVFSINDSFMASIPKSEIRFEIDQLFKEHEISIPFPQRDIYIKQAPK